MPRMFLDGCRGDVVEATKKWEAVRKWRDELQVDKVSRGGRLQEIRESWIATKWRLEFQRPYTYFSALTRLVLVADTGTSAPKLSPHQATLARVSPGQCQEWRRSLPRSHR